MKPCWGGWEQVNIKAYFIMIWTWPISISVSWASSYFIWRQVAIWKMKTEEPWEDWCSCPFKVCKLVIVCCSFFNPALPYVINTRGEALRLGVVLIYSNTLMSFLPLVLVINVINVTGDVINQKTFWVGCVWWRLPSTEQFPSQLGASPMQRELLVTVASHRGDELFVGCVV